jgi:hypothetical protein
MWNALKKFLMNLFGISWVIVVTDKHTCNIHTYKLRWLHNLLAELMIQPRIQWFNLGFNDSNLVPRVLSMGKTLVGTVTWLYKNRLGKGGGQSIKLHASTKKRYTSITRSGSEWSESHFVIFAIHGSKCLLIFVLFCFLFNYKLKHFKILSTVQSTKLENRNPPCFQDVSYQIGQLTVVTVFIFLIFL